MGNYRAGKLDLTHRDAISARLRLYLTTPVFEAWEAVCGKEDSLWWDLNERPSDGRMPIADWDEPVVQDLESAIRDFYDVARRGIDAALPRRRG
jgi:hypothetical protein